MQKKFKLLATSSSGLESLVARELRNLEIENVSIDDRSRVFFEGNLATIAKANLWLRTADRVKIVVGEFKARTFDELFENVYALPWAELIPFGSQFPVSKAKAVKSTLHNEPSIQSITKKAIVKKTWAEPPQNTGLLRRISSLTESSMPMENSKNTTPTSARISTS